MPEPNDSDRKNPEKRPAQGGNFVWYIVAASVVLLLVFSLFTSGSREIEVRMTNGPPDDSFTFEPPLTTVTYNVPLFQFDLAREADDFYAFVPYDEIVEDTTGSVYPMVNVPEGILLREIHIFPEAFRYYRNLPGLD